MKFKFPSINKYLGENEAFMTSNEKSKMYVHIPELMSQYGGGLLTTLRMRRPIILKMVGCIKESMKSASSITKNPHQNKTVMTTLELQELETYIKSLGIDLIGYAKVTPDLIFKDHKILYENAIVLVMQMKPEDIKTAPSKQSIKEIFRTYHGLGVDVNKIADYLRKRGYNAMAGPAIGGDVNYVPLAHRANLGAIGKHGLLITEKPYGPSLRIAAVYTDISNLPVTFSHDYEWVNEFCNKCKKCVRSCPGKAIYENPTADGTCINKAKCAVPFANNYGCSQCIKNCTFFNVDYHLIKDKFNQIKMKAQ